VIVFKLLREKHYYSFSCLCTRESRPSSRGKGGRWKGPDNLLPPWSWRGPGKM